MMISIIITLLQQNLILLLCVMKPLHIPLVNIWLYRRLQKVPELLLILLWIIKVVWLIQKWAIGTVVCLRPHGLLGCKSISFNRVRAYLMILFKSIDESSLISSSRTLPRYYHVDDWIVVADKVDVVLGWRLLGQWALSCTGKMRRMQMSISKVIVVLILICGSTGECCTACIILLLLLILSIIDNIISWGLHSHLLRKCLCSIRGLTRLLWICRLGTLRSRTVEHHMHRFSFFLVIFLLWLLFLGSIHFVWIYIFL